jgi:MOSC domain-containing protein YiiM
MSVLHIFIAPLKGAPTRGVELVDALAGRGLEGDRYVERPGTDGQVTLIESEHIEAFAQATGFAMRPDMPRRNIVTRGDRLNGLVGKRFRVGKAVFEAFELCEPCRIFQRNTHPEALRFFAGKGGLRARIVSGGVVRVGDALVAEG